MILYELISLCSVECVQQGERSQTAPMAPEEEPPPPEENSSSPQVSSSACCVLISQSERS